MSPPDDEGRPRRGRKLSEEERALWRGVAGSLKPLRRRFKPLAEAAESSSDKTIAVSLPLDKPTRAAGRTAQPDRPKKPTVAAAPPPAVIARRERRHIARGKIAIDARVDLHGLTQAEAHGELLRFLRRAQRDDCRVVLVITGKGIAGRDSETGFGGGERGVLRRQVPLWLGLPEFRPIVSQFDHADAGHGGEGALYVRLRRI